MLLFKHRFFKLMIPGSLLFVFLVYPLFATTEIEKKMQELQEINGAITKFEKLYDQKELEERKVLGQIRQLENNLDNLEKDISTLESEITKTEEILEAAQEEIKKAASLVEERTDYLNARLNYIYLEGDISYLDVLFQATSVTDFLTRFDFLEKIAENDATTLKELEKVRKQLLKKEAELQEGMDNFHTLKKQKEYKQRQIELQSRQKSNLLKSIQEQKGEYIKSIDELDEVRKNLDQFIREWQASHKEAYMGSGKMAWPLPGYSKISSSFGDRIHPIYKVKRFHSAVDIPAPMGTIIQAAERGKVLYAGNKGGYGRAIILDHGGGISTQYSHLHSYLVKVGDVVNKGQPIGKVGSSGWSTGPHLDFIVRVQGEPQNPLKYVKP